MNKGDTGDGPLKIHVFNTSTEIAKNLDFFVDKILRIATVGSLIRN